MDSETGNVIRNEDIKWDLAHRIFYIEQDGTLKLPEGEDYYIIDFDPNEVKAGDFLFVSRAIKGKSHIILIKEEKFEKFVKAIRELRSKQMEENKTPLRKVSYDDCDNCEPCIC
ncbi:MAG: hypothetical protein SPJ27_09380 [Candidatus Onthovivens sp.]|nr:hypothetical protein [Candidatus Onthovivens sp.]